MIWLVSLFLLIQSVKVDCYFNKDNVNITYILHQYSLLCGPKFTYNRSNIWNLLDVSYNFSVCPVCFNDDLCFTNGNCCPDRDLDYPATKCLTQIVSVQTNISTVFHEYEMIDTCPEGTNVNIMNLCSTLQDKYDLLTYPPVTCSKYKLSFKNKYCAMCNNVKHYLPWTLQIYDCNIESNPFSDLDDIYTEAIKGNCTIVFEPPLQDLYSKVQLCTNKIYIDECNVTGTWMVYASDIEYACKYLHNPFAPYKNIFCFICNPPNRTVRPIVNSCNVTGQWRKHDSKINYACMNSGQSEATFPYKNIYCQICNVDNNQVLVNRKLHSVFYSYEKILHYYLYDNSSMSSPPHKSVYKPVSVLEKNITIEPEIHCRKEYHKWKYRIDCLYPIPFNPVEINLMESILEKSVNQSCNITENTNEDFQVCIKDTFNASLCLNPIIVDGNLGCEQPLFIRILGNGYMLIVNPCETSDQILVKQNDMVVNTKSIVNPHKCYYYDCKANQYIYPLKYIFCRCCNRQMTGWFTELVRWDIFSLGFYSAECKLDEIYDSIKDKCRRISCFTGKHLMGESCRPYLERYKYALPVEYILPVKFTLRNFTFERKNFQSTLETEMEDILESKFNISSVCCTTLGKIQNTYFYHVLIDIYNFSSVLRLETQLINFLSNITKYYSQSIYVEYDVNSLHQNVSKINQSRCFSNNAQLVSNLLVCPHVLFDSNEYVLRSDTLIVELNEYDVAFQFYEYHIDRDSNLRICIEDFRHMLEKKDTTCSVQYFIMTACIIISALCLLITLLTYCLFSPLRTLPGKNIMNLSLCILLFQISFLLLATLQTENESLCIMIGISTHYFLLCTFGSFSVCAIHMYKIFGKRSLVSAIEAGQRKRLFCIYLVSVYGSSMIFIAGHISIIYIITESNSFGYGRNGKCFVSDLDSFIVTVLTPLVVVFIVNISLFSVTTYRLKDKTKLKSTLSESQTVRRHEFIIFIKLFITTGCSWILLLVNFFVNDLTVYLIIIVCNTLQGVYIFLAYICNKRIYLMYKAKLYSLRHRQDIRSSRSTTHSSLSPPIAKKSSSTCSNNFNDITSESQM